MGMELGLEAELVQGWRENEGRGWSGAGVGREARLGMEQGWKHCALSLPLVGAGLGPAAPPLLPLNVSSHPHKWVCPTVWGPLH